MGGPTGRNRYRGTEGPDALKGHAHTAQQRGKKRRPLSIIGREMRKHRKEKKRKSMHRHCRKALWTQWRMIVKRRRGEGSAQLLKGGKAG